MAPPMRQLTCRSDAVIAGSAWFNACFRQLDPEVHIEWQLARRRQGKPQAP